MESNDLRLRPPDLRASDAESIRRPLPYAVEGRTPTRQRVPRTARLFFGLGFVILALAALPLYISLTTEYSADRPQFAGLAAALALPGAIAIGAGFGSIWLRRTH